MLQEEENKVNNEEQSSETLNQENRTLETPTYPLWKRGVLLAIGLLGLELVAFLVALMVQGMAKSDQAAATTLITYSILFLGMIGFVFVDIKKFLFIFKGWKPYVFAIAFGVGMILFDIGYVNFVGLFYPISTGGNEEGVRDVISLYPIASVFILGILGPLVEELAYRVGLFGLLRRVHRALAYAVSALIFGLLHFDFRAPDLINELILLPTYVVPGLALALAYDLFGLPCSWMAHAINNVFAIIMNILSKYFG